MLAHDDSCRIQRYRGGDLTPSGSEDDDALLAGIEAGDEAAFTKLVERYHGPFVRLALNFVASRPVAEEVAQEAWVAILERIGAFEGRSSLRTWMLRIVTNRAKTRGVRERRSVPFSAMGESGDTEPVVDPSRFKPDGSWRNPPERWENVTPEQIASGREARQCLERALDALPPNQRTVVALRDVEGLSAEEVCNVLDVTETNQRVLLHRGRAKLRKALELFVDGV